MGSPPARWLLPLLFWVAVWTAAALAVSQELLIPGPRLVLSRLLELGAAAEFWIAAGKSLLRIFTGFLCGAALGTLLAAATAASGIADLLLSPAIKVVRATPVASFIVLVLLWVRTGWVPAVISALMVIPVVWGNVSRGIAEVDRDLLEAAEAYRFGKWKTLVLLYIPSVRPYFVSGCVTALGLAWKAGIAAEVLCWPKEAIGTQLYYSKLYLETPSLFAWTLVVIVLSMLLEQLLKALFRLRKGERNG
jgi:NitT/TauT family transport system permease protein